MLSAFVGVSCSTAGGDSQDLPSLRTAVRCHRFTHTALVRAMPGSSECSALLFFLMSGEGLALACHQPVARPSYPQGVSLVWKMCGLKEIILGGSVLLSKEEF